MTRAKYIAETNELQELPEMNRPNELNYMATSRLYKHDMDNYNAHLATLRTIPCDPSAKDVFKDGEVYEEGKDYEVVAPLVAIPITVKTEDGWLTEKPAFTEECILITASKVKEVWHYNFWLIEKLDDMEDKWYWGILCPDGDEWGDLADLEADKYLVIPKLK